MKQTQLYFSNRLFRLHKYLFALLILFVFNGSIFSANDYGFTYDASGNRTKRTILVLRSAEIKEDNSNAENKKDVNSLENEITVYPNPTEGHLVIDIKNLSETQMVSLTLLDMRGQLLINKKGLGAVTDLDISSYASATYVLRILIDGKSTEWKIIKK